MEAVILKTTGPIDDFLCGAQLRLDINKLFEYFTNEPYF